MTTEKTATEGGPHDATILPLLARFTHEDKEAKGLRAFSGEAAGPRRPVHFTAAEMVFMFPALLLHAPDGGGKTTFGRLLSEALNGDGRARDTCFRPAYRNAEGDLLAQDLPEVLPQAVLCGRDDDVDAMLSAILAGDDAPVLLIIDALETRADPEALLARCAVAITERPSLRLLILCESRALEGIRRPASIPEYGLLGLALPERAVFETGNGLSAAHDDRAFLLPGLWRLSLERGRPVAPRDAAALAPADADWAETFRDATALEAMSDAALLEAVTARPDRWAGPLDLLCDWIGPDAPRAAALARGLARSEADLPVLLCAGKLVATGTPEAEALTAALVDAIATGGAPAGLRRRAGEVLARLGDPRDLEELASVAAGLYPMGGDIHPNSAPPHHAPVGDFRIGVYPVVNAAYLRFVTETGRSWKSVNGRDPERASHPATDLTWHDARAYCVWVTEKWRAEGRIGAEEIARLPFEREWEAAARGPSGLIYPWGETWAAEHADGEETGFNDICTVGLFPEGRAPSGTLDMAGQVWEWCTTLWGPDMATPSFAFPWQADGREALDAPADIRRVLRGGCFSSPAWKANGVYRGSLEPAGSWRGNGFRIVVAKG
ncbi:formylglycine-generating enzyme family protein [Martelella limonii]|uniref:formylglycine-generating enzyme family protein n=1 Tax=Martelella limonii TaxID=1647649 RepID=UPI0015810B18|nr:formylglycine-generating enzyme family protein [Martelella limonii]